MKLVIAKIGNHQTIRFAFDELVRCLKTMDTHLFVEGRTYDTYDADLDNVLWIGKSDFVAFSADDEIYIDVKNGTGIISGSNERAVLIAVYRFLTELGCRWIRPGQDGEILKKQSITANILNVSVAEKASYRHRAVCIEGWNSYEHVYNMIDWLPKVGLNGYYMQFMIPYTFFQNRYEQDIPPVFADKPLTVEAVRHIWNSLEEEIEKRSLLYHATGHGWTCEPFGIQGIGWKVETAEIAPEIKQYYAEVNGKRDLWCGKVMNTNLCYSNTVVRERMTDAIVTYCREHPTVDYLHFWLADGSNNQCECEDCRKMRPADYYVTALNELDQKLTAAGIDTKVVFLIYNDLLWAPEYHKINNPERFVLMFAPITRTYSHAFVDANTSQEVELAPYERNKIIRPKSVAENLAYLRSWQEQFSGDSFDFDYHLMWDHVLDPGYYECSRILHRDMTNLDKIGLNGMVSCQVQRTAFPTGLPMYAMAKALWDKSSDFEKIASDYFEASFGADGEAVRDYLHTLSTLFHPPYMRLELPQINEAVAADFIKAKKVIEKFEKDYIMLHISAEEHTDRDASWKYLKYHAEYCILLADMLKHRALGDNAATRDKATEIKEYLKSIQADTHNVLDVQNYWHVLLGRFEEEVR